LGESFFTAHHHDYFEFGGEWGGEVDLEIRLKPVQCG
jgi:hypothetical protein